MIKKKVLKAKIMIETITKKYSKSAIVYTINLTYLAVAENNLIQ